MYKGTTPTYIFTFPEDVDISQADEIYVSIGDLNGEEILRLTGNDLDVVDNTVQIYLDQAQTLALPSGRARCQLNWIYQDGAKLKRACSQIMTISVRENMIGEVLPV